MDLEFINNQTNKAYGPPPGIPPVVDSPEWSNELREHALQEVHEMGLEAPAVPGFLGHLWHLLRGGSPPRMLLHLSPEVMRDIGLPEQASTDHVLDTFRGGFI